jgi:hypothetical protein
MVWSHALRALEPRVTALARPVALVGVNYRPVFSSERALHTKKPQISVDNFREKERRIGRGSQMIPLIPGQAGRLTICRNITLICCCPETKTSTLLGPTEYVPP